MVQITSLYVFVLTLPSLAQAAVLDEYYLSRFGQHPGGQERIDGVSETHPGQEFEPCYTPVFHGLRSDWTKLLPGTQKILAKVFGKPVLAGEAIAKTAEGHFAIHYATSGSDAPPLADLNNNGIPDWVEKVAEVFEAVYNREVLEMGYQPAPTVGGQPYDVYLENLGGGSLKYLGFANSDVPLSSTSFTSYITVDNDFAEFGARYSAFQYLQSTAAHEYHHAIQYGYNFYFDTWYAEATSTWIEDEVFDSVNQLYDYLPAYLQNPRLPLDTPVSVSSGGGYSRWIFSRYLAEINGRDIIRTILERLQTKPAPVSGNDIPMIPVLNEVLGGALSDYVVGLGKRFVLNNWVSHQNEISLIHPFVTEPITDVISYPSEPYSFALYTENSPPDLSAKPAGVAALYLQSTLLLCNNLTGSTAIPPDPSQPIPSLQDAQLSVKAPTLIAGPTLNSTAPSGGGGGGGGGGCFIATAAYGSYMHPKVEVLRGFRDRCLITNPFGRMFVTCYYRVSPSMAAVIARHKWMRLGCRALLAPLIATVEHPDSVASLLLGLLGWVLIRRRVSQYEVS